MANVITGRQWVLDTVANTDVWPWSNVNVKHVEFYGYGNATDVGILKDRNDRIVAEMHGNADLSPIISQDIGWVDGMKFTGNSSGTGKFLVYIE